MWVGLGILALAIGLFALFDCLPRDPRSFSALPKPFWVAAIMLVPFVGPVAWLVSGRGHLARGGAAKPLAPDDDPDFLRSLRPKPSAPPPPPPDDGTPPDSGDTPPAGGGA